MDLDDYEEEQDHLDACPRTRTMVSAAVQGEVPVLGSWGRAPDPLADVIHRPETLPLEACNSAVLGVFRGMRAAVSTPDWRAFHRRKPYPLPIKSQYASCLC